MMINTYNIGLLKIIKMTKKLLMMMMMNLMI